MTLEEMKTTLNATSLVAPVSFCGGGGGGGIGGGNAYEGGGFDPNDTYTDDPAQGGPH